MSRTAVILTPAREGGRFRTAVNGHDPLAPLAPEECHFWLEIETPIEVQRFDPRNLLYYRAFEKSDVQKHQVFDTLLSLKVQKHKENVTCSKYKPKSLRKTTFLKKKVHFECTIVLLNRNASFSLHYIAFSVVQAHGPEPVALGPWVWARAQGPGPMIPRPWGSWSGAWA